MGSIDRMFIGLLLFILAIAAGALVFTVLT
jgi:hypothetical protein